MENLNILVNGEKINVKVINMNDKKVISPFFLTCSHYKNGKYLSCDKNKLKTDERVCCNCNFYDGGEIVGLKLDDGINFMIYPGKKIYSFTQLRSHIKTKKLLENL